MSSKFKVAAEKVAEINEQFFAKKTISSLEHGRLRSEVLGKALFELAAQHGVNLVAPLFIDSRGEYKITAIDPSGRDPKYGAGHFGEAFASILNGHSPRCGVSPGAIMHERDGWCMMNHFEVEKMILAAANLV